MLKEYSLKSESFFSNSDLKIGRFLFLIFYLVYNETNIDSLKRKTGIKSERIIFDC
jgi:hypothetical protein